MINFTITNISSAEVILPYPFSGITLAVGETKDESVSFENFFNNIEDWNNVIRELKSLYKNQKIESWIRVDRQAKDVMSKILMLYGVIGGAAKGQNRLSTFVMNALGGQGGIVTVNPALGTITSANQRLMQASLMPMIELFNGQNDYTDFVLWECNSNGTQLQALTSALSTQNAILHPTEWYDFAIIPNRFTSYGSIIRLYATKHGAGQVVVANCQAMFYQDYDYFQIMEL